VEEFNAYFPDAQFVHEDSDDAPTDTEYFPSEQYVHADPRTVDEYIPVGQA
jgi:hypothetical protein